MCVYIDIERETFTRFMYVTKIMNKKGKLACTSVIENYLKVNNIVNENEGKKALVDAE